MITRRNLKAVADKIEGGTRGELIQVDPLQAAAGGRDEEWITGLRLEKAEG